MDLRRAVGCGVDQPARNFTAMADGPSTAQDPVAMDMAVRPLRMLCPDMQGIGTTCLKYSHDSADRGPGSTMSDGPSTTTEPVAMDMVAWLEDHGVITPTLDSCRSISTISRWFQTCRKSWFMSVESAAHQYCCLRSTINTTIRIFKFVWYLWYLREGIIRVRGTAVKPLDRRRP